MGLSLLWSTNRVFSLPSFEMCRCDTRKQSVVSWGCQELCSRGRNVVLVLPGQVSPAPAAIREPWPCCLPCVIQQPPTSNFKAAVVTQHPTQGYEWGCFHISHANVCQHNNVIRCYQQTADSIPRSGWVPDRGKCIQSISKEM